MALFDMTAVAAAIDKLTAQIKGWRTEAFSTNAQIKLSLISIEQNLQVIATILSRPGPARYGRLVLKGPHDRFIGGGHRMHTTILDSHSYTIGLDPAGYTDAIGAPAPAPTDPSVLSIAPDGQAVLESRPSADTPDAFDIQAKLDGTGQPAVNQPVQVTITKGSVVVTDDIDVGGDAAVSGRFQVSAPKDRF